MDTYREAPVDEIPTPWIISVSIVSNSQKIKLLPLLQWVLCSRQRCCHFHVNTCMSFNYQLTHIHNWIAWWKSKRHSSMAIPRCTSCGCLEWTRAHDKRRRQSCIYSWDDCFSASKTSLSHPCQCSATHNNN